MKKVLIGTTLAAGMIVTGAAQAHTEDALLGGLIGVAIGASITDHHDHRRVVHHYDHRPVRQYHASPRYSHHHPRGKAHGYWRKHDKHHYRAHRSSHHDRRDWGRDDRRGRRDR